MPARPLLADKIYLFAIIKTYDNKKAAPEGAAFSNRG